MRGVLTQDQKQLAFRLKAEGLSLKEIARQVGCTAPMVALMVRDGRFLTGLPDTWRPRPGRLMIREREQVLLGLARGSGARSLSGMPARRGPYVRPLLGVARATTTAACEAAGLTAWVDPHNIDPAYGRVRARALLPLLETELGPGAVAALARSADLLRDDADALDDLAARARDEIGQGPAEATVLLTMPRAIRTRVLRLLAIEAGCPPGALVATHVDALDLLVSGWRGQGPVDLPGHVQGSRSGGRVSVAATGPVE